MSSPLPDRLPTVAEPATVAAPTQLWRVARSDDPLRMSTISAADNALAGAGNRFDTTSGGVLYCSTEPRTCYLETLARFRPSPAVRAVVADEDPEFMVCGGVPADWRARRVKVAVALQDPLPFLDVEDLRTHEYLTTELSSVLAGLGVGVLDTAAVRGPNRRLTRAISNWAFAAGLDDGGTPHYGGIRYLSRMGDFECWAVFEGTSVVEISRDTISLHDPDLISVAATFGLRPF